MRPIGKNQLQVLRDFMGGERRFVATRKGEPWPVMLGLIKRGYLRVEKRQVQVWSPVYGTWTGRPFALTHRSAEKPGTEYWAQTTPTGLRLIRGSVKQ